MLVRPSLDGPDPIEMSHERPHAHDDFYLFAPSWVPMYDLPWRKNAFALRSNDSYIPFVSPFHFFLLFVRMFGLLPLLIYKRNTGHFQSQ